MNKLSCAVIIFVFGMLCSGCFLGGQGSRQHEGPGHYERAWVDPQLIVSDSLITLIRSDRVDKVFVADKERKMGESQPSFEFVINQDICTVQVDLVTSKGLVAEPLFDGTLRPGNYKLTVDPSRISPEVKRQSLSVRADYCGRKQSFKILTSD